MRHTRLAFAGIVLSLASIAAAGQAKIDLSGKWLFSVTTAAGNGTPTVTLKQEGEKLTGHYASATLGEAELTGTVTGNAVQFTFGADVQGTHLDVTYKGTIESNNSLKGTVNLGIAGDGTFTAARQ